MEHYIDKSALVAEIERLYNGEIDTYTRNILDRLKSKIHTLEVKEVDLQSEIDRVWDNTSNNFLEDGWKEFEDIAKHFFELGLNAQCKISHVPNIDDSLEKLGVDPSSREAKIFKESYYIALEKLKAQKGEKV